jgi:hypothetical protein
LLLAVYHDLDDEHREHMKSQGVVPADYVGADDLGRQLGDDFTVKPHGVEPRIDRPPGAPTTPTSSCAPGVADRAAGRRRKWYWRPEVPLSRVRVACEPVTWVSASWTCPRRNRP